MKKTNVCSRCGKGPKVNRSWCRECLRIYDQEYRKRNAKRLKIYRNKYQLTVYKEKNRYMTRNTKPKIKNIIEKNLNNGVVNLDWIYYLIMAENVFVVEKQEQNSLQWII